ncbi:RICIN domain-containing protein [Paradesertivirga mongoliensis]|uniref:RICIN domain-containing protein n=1 Tax=Paradesertivirga mongoliensis TaxID=2100740 RepID=A0ABW4ZKK4_9SPHI|nr:RICIN domain-containing protein [Pedobacter mongoliensis]
MKYLHFKISTKAVFTAFACILVLLLSIACKKGSPKKQNQIIAESTDKTAVATTSSVIWVANPADGASNTFKATGTGNVEAPSSITSASDASRGTVWRFHKPSGSNRCENHGIKVNGSGYVFQNNTVYYLGWYTKLTNTSDNNANFQWKSYGSHTQNFPLVLKMISGQLSCQYTAPGGSSSIIWDTPFSANTWYHIALAIRTDDNASEGYVELWFNGVKQTFNNGSQRYYGRTWDTGDHNCPKWGCYGRSDLDISNYIDDLKLGTSYADVAMSGSGGSFSGYYRITPRHSGKALVVESASVADAANVIQYTYGGSNTNDEWQLSSIGSGYYRIINRNSGKDMTVQSASTSDGANIFQYTYGGSATNDEWQIVDNGGGYYRIVNRNSGKVVEVAGSSTSDGANVNQRTWSGGTNQQFQLVTIP